MCRSPLRWSVPVLLLLFGCTSGLDSAISVSAGAWLGTGHIRFTPKIPGSFEFFCHVDHHAKKGMTGTLVVVP